MKPLCALAVLACLAGIPCAAATATNAVIPALPVSTLLDPDQGQIFGVPFGATEETIVQSLGSPAGHIHLGEHRDALLYGRSQLLLLYDGKLDGIRISYAVIDFDVANWLPDYQDWQLSNGIAPQMTRPDVLARVMPVFDDGDKWHLTYRTPRAVVQISFSHRGDMSEGDDSSYGVNSILVAQLDAGGDHWSHPPSPARFWPPMLPGRKLLGLQLKGAAADGIQVGYVFPNSPAAKAGIMANDVITALDSKSLAGTDLGGFGRMVMQEDAHTLTIKSSRGDIRSVQLELVDASSFGRGRGHTNDPTGITAGQQAPDFTAASEPDAPAIALSAVRGHPALVLFTATWCEPCKEEAPQIKALHDQYAARGVHFFSVYLDGDAAPKVYAFAHKLGVNWPINTDAKGWDNVVARRYGILGVPTHVLVGKDGRILQANVPAAALAAALDDALK